MVNRRSEACSAGRLSSVCASVSCRLGLLRGCCLQQAGCGKRQAVEAAEAACRHSCQAVAPALADSGGARLYLRRRRPDYRYPAAPQLLQNAGLKCVSWEGLLRQAAFVHHRFCGRGRAWLGGRSFAEPSHVHVVCSTLILFADSCSSGSSMARGWSCVPGLGQLVSRTALEPE